MVGYLTLFEIQITGRSSCLRLASTGRVRRIQSLSIKVNLQFYLLPGPIPSNLKIEIRDSAIIAIVSVNGLKGKT
jgi:hypothetical protein